MEHLARQPRFRRPVVFQLKMRALVLPVILFLVLVSKRLIQSRLHFRIRPQRQRFLPLGHSLVRPVQPVIRPAFQLVNIRTLRRVAFRPLQIFERLLELASPQIHVGQLHQRGRIFGRVKHSRPCVRQCVLQVAPRHFESRSGMMRPRGLHRLFAAACRSAFQMIDVVAVHRAIVHGTLVDFRIARRCGRLGRLQVQVRRRGGR